MPTATGPNGEKIELVNGQWVPIDTPQPGPLLEQALKSGSPAVGNTSGTRQGFRTAGAQVVSNALSTPHAAGNIMSSVAALPKTAFDIGANIASGQPMDIGGTYSKAREAASNTFPMSLLKRVPNVESEDVLAGVNAAARLPQDMASEYQRYRESGGPAPNPFTAIGRSYDLARQDEQAMTAAHPIATGVGRVGGDALSLILGKQGMKSMLGLKSASNTSRTVKALDGLVGSLRRVGGRAAEAGAEGAVIAALHDEDPAKTAATTAGIQTAGNLALMAKGAVMRNPGKALLGIWMGHEIWKAIAPGPQNALESKDAAMREIIAAYGIGVLGAMAGAGRGSGSGLTSEVANLFSTGSRGAIASVVTQLQKSGEGGDNRLSLVLDKMMQDPAYFGEEALRRMESAAESAKDNALIQELDSLMSSESFRQRYEQLRQGEQQ